MFKLMDYLTLENVETIEFETERDALDAAEDVYNWFGDWPVFITTTNNKGQTIHKLNYHYYD